MKLYKAQNIVTIVLFSMCLNMGYIQAQENDKKYLQDPESLIRELYKTVSQKSISEKLPDWDKVRDMFYEKALVSLRVSRVKYQIFDVAGFIKDFQDFYQEPGVKANGFTETILNLKKSGTGKLAHILTLYEARIVNGVGNQGVDSWQLIYKDNRWWIFSITNEVIDKDTPVPEVLK